MLKNSAFQIAILLNSITGMGFLVFYCESVCHISTKKMSKDFSVAWRWRYSVFELYDCMSIWGGRFCGYPCQTNEPAELAGCGGSSVDWSRAKQSVLWFTGPMISQRGSLLGCSTTLTTSACAFPFPRLGWHRGHPNQLNFCSPIRALSIFQITIVPSSWSQEDFKCTMNLTPPMWMCFSVCGRNRFLFNEVNNLIGAIDQIGPVKSCAIRSMLYLYKRVLVSIHYSFLKKECRDVH